jgi:hypothetical protein
MAENEDEETGSMGILAEIEQFKKIYPLIKCIQAIS